MSDKISVAETSDPEEEPEIALNLVSSIDFKCDQYVYGNTIQKDLAQHKQIKHRIYQVDGVPMKKLRIIVLMMKSLYQSKKKIQLF